MPTLREVLPREFLSGGYEDSPAYRFLDASVIEKQEGRWPGRHKNVWAWWVLENGYAVGWNENPSLGWSFPIYKMKKVLKMITPDKVRQALDMVLAQYFAVGFPKNTVATPPLIKKLMEDTDFLKEISRTLNIVCDLEQ